MKVPDLTQEEAHTIADNAYYMNQDRNSDDSDYLITIAAYRRGVDAARNDILELLALMVNDSDMKHMGAWQEALEEITDYMHTNLTPEEWCDDSE